MDISHLNPERVWKNFYALTRIPRPSKHEEQVSKYLEKFGKDPAALYEMNKELGKRE